MQKNNNSGNMPVDREIHLQNRFIQCYKKNTIAIFLSFALSIMLITALLILIFTNHRTENIQYQMLYSAADCRIAHIPKTQVEQIKKSDLVAWYAVEQHVGYRDYYKGLQSVYMDYGDDTYITMTTKLLEGRMPRSANEVVAEKWTLLNLGVEPDCGRQFTIKIHEGNIKKRVKLVGIISDNSSYKEIGSKVLYGALSHEKDAEYSVYIRLKDGVNYKKYVSSLVRTLQIKKKQVTLCPAREDMGELRKTAVSLCGILIVICMVVFYGIYRITLLSRRKEYGILRAVGMQRGQLKAVIMKELYQIYAVSIPAGLLGGMLVSLLILHLSGDNRQDIYLNNQKVTFHLVTPYGVIFGSVFIVALMVGLIGDFAGRKISNRQVTELIANSGRPKKRYFVLFTIRNRGSRNGTLLVLGCKYIFKDIKTSLFVILTICLGVTLFTGLSYQFHTIAQYHEDTIERGFLNGQYAMGLPEHPDEPGSVYHGVSYETAENIAKLKEVAGIKSEAGIPVRVLDDGKVKRNSKYYNEMNQYMVERGCPLMGNDGTDQIYKSVLYGYNETALHNLKKYVIEGNYNESGIKDNEIILSILSIDDTKQNEFPGSYKEGTPLMQYHAGDEIRVKYRADFKTYSTEYEKLKDKKAKYVYKTYKVAAIVCFEYIRDCKTTLYPLLITGENQVKSICPDIHIQNMYIDGKKNLGAEEQAQLERKLIRLGINHENVSTRSVISEIEKNDMIFQKQMVYILGIVVVAFVLILMNVYNNLKYRMQVRVREIAMFRAIGMSFKMVRKIMLFENCILGIIGIGFASFPSQPVLRYLYRQSDMKAFGHSFQFDYRAFLLVSFAVMVISFVVTIIIARDWKTNRIVEQMGSLE